MNSYLSPQGIAEMHAPAVHQDDGGYWGIGWDIGEYDGMTVISRVGDVGNSHATLVLIPESDFGLILLANASGFEHLRVRVLDSTALGVFNMLNGKPAAPVSVPFLMHLL